MDGDVGLVFEIIVFMLDRIHRQASPFTRAIIMEYRHIQCAFVHVFIASFWAFTDVFW